MFKKTLFLLLVPISAMAEGKLMLGLPFASTLNQNEPEAGLFIQERLTDKLYYQSWTGGRLDRWFSSWHGAMWDAGRGTMIGVGPQMYISPSVEVRGMIFIEKRLW
jgi:hypothetical protein